MPTMTESNRKLHGEVQAEARQASNDILGETEGGGSVGGGKELYSGVLSLYG